MACRDTVLFQKKKKKTLFAVNSKLDGKAKPIYQLGVISIPDPHTAVADGLKHRYAKSYQVGDETRSDSKSKICMKRGYL